MRYAIKHLPTNKIIDSNDDGELYLIDEDESFTTFGKLEYANESLVFLKDYCCNEHGEVYTDKGEFPIEDFKVVEL